VELPADYLAGASHGSELMHLFEMAGRPGAIGPVDVDKIHRCDFWRSLD
jgi:hypothetical protein